MERSGEQSTLVPDIWSLTYVFTAWKLLLFCIACASPGPGYDTSTHLLFHQHVYSDSIPTRILAHVALRLVRWDALYFTNIAQRGYLYEQEWAFGWGFTRFLTLISKVIPAGHFPPLYVQALAGIIASHACHLLSVLILYGVTYEVSQIEQSHRRKIAFIAASLHIFSPAGLFLSAPYSETLFAVLNLLGTLIHAQIPRQQLLHQYGPSSLLSLLGSGVCFGLASTIRGNGVLSGLIFLYHVFILFQSHVSPRTIMTIAVIGISGILILMGTLIPQYIAYREFCVPDDLRPWCLYKLPSIFSWVQSHYWNVGFLRYWTMSNLPLFLLALPMLFILVSTGMIASSKGFALTNTQSTQNSVVYMRCLALPQILLAVLAFTSFHVQIINRISTGYPIWYMTLATIFTLQDQPHKKKSSDEQSESLALIGRLRSFMDRSITQQVIFRSMLMYAIIQGGLYASFLPPA